MIDRLPRRLRVAFTKQGEASSTERPDAAAEPTVVDFVAYGEDCILFGKAVLDADRLSDMLNSHDEYALVGVSVERFDGGATVTVDDVVVPRDELLLVHAAGPRGDVRRRHRTMPHHVAMKMGRYQVRGFYHGLPGTDPVVSIRRRKSMVPLTDARIEYTIGDDRRETLVETLIVNRDLIDWVEAMEPNRAEFPAGPKRVKKTVRRTA
jgi:hypothetical protein